MVTTMEYSAAWFLDAIQDGRVVDIGRYLLTDIVHSYGNIEFTSDDEMSNELTDSNVSFHLQSLYGDTACPPLVIQCMCRSVKYALLERCYALTYSDGIYEESLPVDPIERTERLDDYEKSPDFVATSFLCYINGEAWRNGDTIWVRKQWKIDLNSILKPDCIGDVDTYKFIRALLPDCIGGTDTQRIDIHNTCKFITKLFSREMNCKALIIHLHWITQREAISNDIIRNSRYNAAELYDAVLPKICDLQKPVLHLIPPRLVDATTIPYAFVIWYDCKAPEHIITVMSRSYIVKLNRGRHSRKLIPRCFHCTQFVF